jgi:hypothetical protein
MQQNGSSRFFLILVVGAAIFVWGTGQFMPETVGSHFGPSGTADGFVPRAYYVGFMLAVVVALPLVLVLLPGRLLRNPKMPINLPNRDYWLAPERRAETIDYLVRHSTYFGSMLVVFLCYVHWLVVRANALTPPSLSSPWFIGGLVVFMVSAIVWVRRLFRKFLATPR